MLRDVVTVEDVVIRRSSSIPCIAWIAAWYPTAAARWSWCIPTWPAACGARW